MDGAAVRSLLRTLYRQVEPDAFLLGRFRPSGDALFGGAVTAELFFYAYAYPKPEGYRGSTIAHGQWSDDFGKWILPYEVVRGVTDSLAMLTEFIESAHVTAREKADWPEGLERTPVAPKKKGAGSLRHPFESSRVA